MAKLPVELAKKPYADLLWDRGREAMAVKGRVVTRDLLRLAIGLPAKEDSVRGKLAGWLGVAVAEVDLTEWIPAPAGG